VYDGHINRYRIGVKMITTVSSAEWAYAGRALSRRIQRLALEATANTGIKPNYTENAPNDHPALLAAYDRAKVTGSLDIWNGASADAIYVPEVNLQFRFWHDMGHIAHDLSFTPDDERELQERYHIWELMNLGIEKGSLPYRLYVADTIGQIDYIETHHKFPDDQAAFDQMYVVDKQRALETVF
jgi:hypothetical protein